MRFALAWVLVLVCSLSSASAATSTATAVVTLEVVNAPPHLASLTISPEKPAMHETLACTADIRDEHPGQNALEVAWLLGDRLLSTGELIVPAEHGLAPGDTLTCIARATDEEGSLSNALTATATLTESTFADRLSGLAGITGFAVAGGQEGSTNSILLAILVILFALNAVLTARHFRKRNNSRGE